MVETKTTLTAVIRYSYGSQLFEHLPWVVIHSTNMSYLNEDLENPLCAMKDEDWSRMKLMITEQLDNVTSNLEDLRKKRCLDSIAFQIERGDSCPSARLISWYLAMLEIEYCSRKAVEKKLNHMLQVHTTAKNKSFVLETHISRAGRPLDASDYQSIVEKLEGKTNLSIVERQDLWNAKKNIKNDAAKARKKEAEEKVRAQSAPNLDRSRRSYRISTEPPRRPKSRVLGAPKADSRPPTLPDPKRSLKNITNNQSKKNSTGNTTKSKKAISDPFTSSRKR